MIFESYCTKLGSRIDNVFTAALSIAYILMILIGLPALLIKVFILN